MRERERDTFREMIGCAGILVALGLVVVMIILAIGWAF